jgi:hypothetical protein
MSEDNHTTVTTATVTDIQQNSEQKDTKKTGTTTSKAKRRPKHSKKTSAAISRKRAKSSTTATANTTSSPPTPPPQLLSSDNELDESAGFGMEESKTPGINNGNDHTSERNTVSTASHSHSQREDISESDIPPLIFPSPHDHGTSRAEHPGSVFNPNLYVALGQRHEQQARHQYRNNFDVSSGMPASSSRSHQTGFYGPIRPEEEVQFIHSHILGSAPMPTTTTTQNANRVTIRTIPISTTSSSSTTDRITQYENGSVRMEIRVPMEMMRGTHTRIFVRDGTDFDSMSNNLSPALITRTFNILSYYSIHTIL